MKNAQIELHAHPYFKKYGLEEVVKAMDRNNLDVVALEYLNGCAFLDVQKQLVHLKQKGGYKVDGDSIAVRVVKELKEFYILRAAELETSDDFHLLTIGSDDTKKQPTRDMIYEADDKGLTIFDHAIVDIYCVWREITGEKRDKVGDICRELQGKFALEWNGYCLKEYWKIKEKMGGKNVNEEVIRLSKRYNVPLVTTTDLHARRKHALKAMGTSRIKADVDVSSGKAIIDSLKEAIFSGKYENTKETVPLVSHFIPYFAIPYILDKAREVFIKESIGLIERPRG